MKSSDLGEETDLGIRRASETLKMPRFPCLTAMCIGLSPISVHPHLHGHVVSSKPLARLYFSLACALSLPPPPSLSFTQYFFVSLFLSISLSVRPVRGLVYLMTRMTSHTDGLFLCPFLCLSVSFFVSPMFAFVYLCRAFSLALSDTLFSEACALDFFVFRHTDTRTHTTDTQLTRQTIKTCLSLNVCISIQKL